MKNFAAFDELRPKLEKQYENVVYSQENCWSEEQLRVAWEMHKSQNPSEERILSRAFLTALILRHAPVGVEQFNPFPGKFETFGLRHHSSRIRMTRSMKTFSTSSSGRSGGENHRYILWPRVK